MTIELIRSETDFMGLKEEWNALLDNSASCVPFLRHEFLSSWWQTKGGGEWDQGELAIILARDHDGRLEGIAPLFQADDRIMFLGSYQISDYLDFIARPPRLSDIVGQLLSYLEDDNFPDWEVVDLYNILEHSPSLPIIRDHFLASDLQLEEKVLQPAPYIQLPEDWTIYLENLKPRYQREIEKKLTSAENYFLPISWYISDDPATLEEDLNDFLELMANHPEKKQFLSPEMVSQMKILGQEAFQAGWLQLAFLQVGDIKAAGYMNFDFADQIWIYNSGINPLFENISPGWVLLGKIIRWAIKNGRTKLDFMRGDETYKYQFGGIDKNILQLRITR